MKFAIGTQGSNRRGRGSKIEQRTPGPPVCSYMDPVSGEPVVSAQTPKEEDPAPADPPADTPPVTEKFFKTQSHECLSLFGTDC